MYKKFDSYDGVCFFNGLVFFAPVALFIRTRAGVSETTFFVLQAILSLVIFAGEIPTGFITDKIGYKKSIVLSQVLMLGARVLILVAFMEKSLIAFVIEAFAEGIASCFSSGTNSAYLYSIYGEDSFAGKTAHSDNYGTAGFVISTVAYAAIYKLMGIEGLIVSTIISGIVALIFSILLTAEKNENQQEEGNISISDFAKLLKNSHGRIYIVMLSAFSLAWLLINFFYAEKIEKAGLKIEWMTAVILGYSVVQMLAEPIIKKTDRFSGKKLLIATGIVSGIGMIAVGCLENVIFMLGAMVILPLLIVLPEYFLMEQENKLIDELGLESGRAAALSVLNMGVNIIEILALFASAALGSIGIMWCFVAVGIMIIAVCVSEAELSCIRHNRK